VARGPGDGVAAHRQVLSDARLASGTGKPAAEWFAILDELGATGWAHARIAAHLVAEHEVAPWWAQGITVRYEQERGLRLPGQQADGTFSVSVSRSLLGGQLELLDLGVERFAGYAGGTPEAVSRSIAHPTARWRLGGGDALLLSVGPPASGKCRVTLTQSRLRLPERVQPVKDALTELFGVLADRQR
jgi:hypothetical protein